MQDGAFEQSAVAEWAVIGMGGNQRTLTALHSTHTLTLCMHHLHLQSCIQLCIQLTYTHLTGSAVQFTTVLQVIAVQVVDMSTGISVHCIVSSTNCAAVWNLSSQCNLWLSALLDALHLVFKFSNWWSWLLHKLAVMHNKLDWIVSPNFQPALIDFFLPW